MIALVRTVEGVFEVDVENEAVLGELDATVDRERSELGLPRLVAAASTELPWSRSSTGRPPLLISGDGGATWREAGGGLPPGFDVAVDPADPDRVLYAARNRLHLSTDGGRFWRSLAPELPDVEAVALVYGTLNSPRATVTAEPPTSTDSISSPGAGRPRVERRGPADLRALLDLDLLAPRYEPVAAEVAGERARRPIRSRRPRRRRRAARTSAPSSSCPSRRTRAPRRGRARRARSGPASARRRPPSTEAPRTRAGRRCRRPRPAARRPRRRAPPAARPRGRTARPSAPAASSSRRRSARTRPARARPGRCPAPVSSAITPSCSGAPRTNAVPRHGCPANGSSLRGVKIRIRTVPPSRGGRTNTRFGEAELERQLLHRHLVEVASVREDGELVARERPVGEDVGERRSETSAYR